MRIKTVVTLTIAVLANAIGNLLLSKGMQHFQPAGVSMTEWLLLASGRILTNAWLISGILLLVIFLVSYFAALSWADLSFVLLATAPSYVLTAALASFFLHEVISPARWAGIILIVGGTGLVAVSYSSRRAEPAQSDWQEEEAVGAGAGSPSTRGSVR